jgi:hypothetical protein
VEPQGGALGKSLRVDSPVRDTGEASGQSLKVESQGRASGQSLKVESQGRALGWSLRGSPR